MNDILAHVERHHDFVLSVFDQPIAFQRIFVDVTGRITSALMLSWAVQQYELGETDNNGWFAKTSEDWSRDTGLSKDEQTTAKRRLIDLGILEEDRNRVDNGLRLVLRYRLNFPVLQQLIIAKDKQSRKLRSAH
jgi:hypothetical protein